MSEQTVSQAFQVSAVSLALSLFEARSSNKLALTSPFPEGNFFNERPLRAFSRFLRAKESPRKDHAETRKLSAEVMAAIFPSLQISSHGTIALMRCWLLNGLHAVSPRGDFFIIYTP